MLLMGYPGHVVQLAAPSTLRNRTRRAVQAEIGALAMRLFLQQGFEATTMEQIAQQAGVSRRSLFRYFPTKEDIVLGNLVETGLEVRAALEARPDEESPWEALRIALASLEKDPARTPETLLKMLKMLYETPSLRAGHFEKQLRWVEFLAPNIGLRLGVSDGERIDPRAQALVACALTCLDVATETWTKRDGQGHLGAIYNELVAAVRS